MRRACEPVVWSCTLLGGCVAFDSSCRCESLELGDNEAPKVHQSTEVSRSPSLRAHASFKSLEKPQLTQLDQIRVRPGPPDAQRPGNTCLNGCGISLFRRASVEVAAFLERKNLCFWIQEPCLIKENQPRLLLVLTRMLVKNLEEH